MNKEFVFQKYKWWELWFHNYRIIRKLSKAFWVRLDKEGYEWVKMDKEFFYTLKFRPELKVYTEDWTI